MCSHEEYVAHEETYKGCDIKIIQDSYTESPREWDNLGTMVYWHRNYILGDVDGSKEYGDAGDFFETLAELYLDDLEEGEGTYLGNGEWGGDHVGEYLYGNRWVTEKEFREIVMAKVDKNYIILPVYAYEHGGITISTGAFSCPWDSGQVGYIYVSVEDVKKEYGWKYLTKKRREQIESYLKGEIKTYDDYLLGNCWYYSVSYPDGDSDTCGGFFGTDHCIEAAKSEVDYWVNAQRKKRFETVKSWIRNKVPLTYRIHEEVYV